MSRPNRREGTVRPGVQVIYIQGPKGDPGARGLKGDKGDKGDDGSSSGSPSGNSVNVWHATLLGRNLINLNNKCPIYCNFSSDCYSYNYLYAYTRMPISGTISKFYAECVYSPTAASWKNITPPPNITCGIYVCPATYNSNNVNLAPTLNNFGAGSSDNPKAFVNLTLQTLTSNSVDKTECTCINGGKDNGASNNQYTRVGNGTSANVTINEGDLLLLKLSTTFDAICGNLNNGFLYIKISAVFQNSTSST